MLLRRTPIAFTVWIGTLRPAFAERPARERANALRRFAEQWLGTPYAFGGSSRSGIDCSGYVQRIYREVLRVEVPRTTVEQIQFGEPFVLNRTNFREGLMPGDLLFFVNRYGHPRHVVLYVEEGRVTHSIQCRGVVIETLESVAGRFIVPRQPSRRTGVEAMGAF